MSNTKEQERLCPNTQLPCPRFTDRLMQADILHKYSIYEGFFRRIQEVMKNEKNTNSKIEEITSLIQELESIERKVDKIILTKHHYNNGNQ